MSIKKDYEQWKKGINNELQKWYSLSLSEILDDIDDLPGLYDIYANVEEVLMAAGRCRFCGEYADDLYLSMCEDCKND